MHCISVLIAIINGFLLPEGHTFLYVKEKYQKKDVIRKANFHVVMKTVNLLSLMLLTHRTWKLE